MIRAPRPLRVLGALLLVPLAGAAAAQGIEALPSCDPAEMEQVPCLADYEVAPVVVEEPPLAVTGETPRVSQVWMLVDTAGTVRVTQIGRTGGGMDWDFAAVARAKEYRFHPATLGGRPTAAWILLPVAAAPHVQTCADFPLRVPLSAGVGQLVDSTVFEEPSLGTSYRYESIAGFHIDVFIYPIAPGASPEDQVEQTVQALESGGVRNGPDSVAVVRRGRERVRLSESGGGGVSEGRFARMRVWFGGETAESYVAVFATPGGFVKFRATHPPSRDASAMVHEFMRQMLSNEAWRERGCPR